MPINDGYTFDGWYTDEDCTHAWNFADGIPGDMTLYAKWIGGDTSQATAKVTNKVTTVPVPAPPSHTASVTTKVPVVTTAAGTQPTLMQAPAPFFGMLAGLLAAGVLLRRQE